MTRQANRFGVRTAMTVALTALLLPATAAGQPAADSRFDDVRLVIGRHGPGPLRPAGFDDADRSLITFLGLPVHIARGESVRITDAATLRVSAKVPSPLSLERAIERQVVRLAELDATSALSLRQLQVGTKIRRCTSTVKGAVFGAIAGAAIGSGFAIFVERGLGDVRPGVVATFAAGGAGVGALAGWGYCR